MDWSSNGILQRIKDGLKLPSSTIEGTFSMDNASAVAEEIARMVAMEVQTIPDRYFIDTAAGTDLDRAAYDLQLPRNQAQAAVGTLVFSGSADTIIPAGTVAYADKVGFQTQMDATIAEDGTCRAPAHCISTGSTGNVAAGTVDTLRPTISGVSVTNDQTFTGGTDTETDDHYRARIIQRLQRPITGGNIAHYEQWALEVPGVSDAKCLDCWAGGGTVKVIVLSDDNGIPDDTIIQNVKEHIEDNRPTGAQVTIAPAESVDVSIAAVVDLADGYSGADVQQAAAEEIRKYLMSLPFRTAAVLSYYRVADIIFSVAGVLDITDHTVNWRQGIVAQRSWTIL